MQPWAWWAVSATKSNCPCHVGSEEGGVKVKSHPPTSARISMACPATKEAGRARTAWVPSPNSKWDSVSLTLESTALRECSTRRGAPVVPEVVTLIPGSSPCCQRCQTSATSFSQGALLACVRLNSVAPMAEAGHLWLPKRMDPRDVKSLGGLRRMHSLVHDGWRPKGLLANACLPVEIASP